MAQAPTVLNSFCSCRHELATTTPRLMRGPLPSPSPRRASRPSVRRLIPWTPSVATRPRSQRAVRCARFACDGRPAGQSNERRCGFFGWHGERWVARLIYASSSRQGSSAAEGIRSRRSAASGRARARPGQSRLKVRSTLFCQSQAKSKPLKEPPVESSLLRGFTSRLALAPAARVHPQRGGRQQQ